MGGFAVADTRVSRSLSQCAETMRMALGRPSASPHWVRVCVKRLLWIAFIGLP